MALLAALAYLPPLLTAPGVVAADTKQYLYLDPGRLLRQAMSLWDPSAFGGWVTHQMIGYLWPLGPWFWVMERAGVPDWVAQRLWIGTLVFAALTGVLVLARLLGLAWYPSVAAAALYGLSPYLLGYVNRTSVLLAPWAALGWMTVCTVLAARRGGWRWPALFALVVVTVGGINATALVLCGLGPALWLAHATWVTGEVPVRRALATAARLGGLALVVSMWWIVALAVQARHGADVLAYSETIQAVSSTSLASEVMRGLGYWLFYGGDVVGRWNSASTPYLTSPGLIALGFGLAALAVVALVVIRWRERTWLAALVLVGLVVSVGAHPYGDPSPVGSALAGASRDTVVLALRSSTRALPLVLLALALAVGGALTGLQARVPTTALAASVAVVVLAALNLPTLWNGTYVDALLRRPSDVPAYWHQAADALSAADDGTRALELPGAEFAAYRWGTTTDPILAGLTDRPTLTRDLLPLGGAATMDLLNALDDRFQEGIVEPAAIAPVARLLSAGAIVYRGDTAFERYRTARPEPAWSVYQDGAPGLGPPVTYGPPAVNQPSVEVIDEAALSDPRIGRAVPPAAVVAVADAPPILRARSADQVTVVDGSGDGLVDAAAAGLLDHPGTVLPAAAMRPDELRAAIAPGAPLVVTDTNRKRAEEWRGSQDTTGFTEDAGQGLLTDDPADNRLPVFPAAGPDAQTLAEQRGGARAVASAYGEANAYRPEDRADRAIDGDPATAWRVGDRGEVIGERLRVQLPATQLVDHVTVVQPIDQPANRWITRLVVRSPAGATTVALTDASRTATGQRIDLPAAAVPWIELEIAATNTGRLASYLGIDAVGLAEVGIDGIAPTQEVVRPPTDLLDALGAASADHPLTYVLTRERVDERNRWRNDAEATIARAVTVATPRAFTISGTAHLTARMGDEGVVLARLLGRPADVVATSTLAGSLVSGGRSATDGDPTTTWQTAFDGALGASVTVSPGRTLTVDHLDLQVVADGRHSVPTALTVTAGGRSEHVALPAVDAAAGGGAVPLHVSFPPVTGDALTVTIAAIEPRTTIDRRSGESVVLPSAVAELGVPGYQAPALPATFDTGCVANRLTVDGQAVPVRLHGVTADALAGAPLTIEPCGGPLALAPGEHIVRTQATVTAVDRLVLSSPAAGAPAASVAADPDVRVTADDPTHREAEISGASGPFWLVLGESHDDGWHASVDGHDLGPPRLVDGGANGWLVTPAGAGPLHVSLSWTPQRFVNAGLVASGIGVAVCAGLAVFGGCRWRRPRRAPAPRPARRVGGRPRPSVAPPFVGEGGPLRWPVVLGLGASAALVTGLVLHPVWALPIGTATAVSARWPRWRPLLTLGAVSGVVLVGLFYVARVVHSEPAAGFGWVSAFERVHRLAFASLLLVVADSAVEAVRSRRTVTAAYDDPARHD